MDFFEPIEVYNPIIKNRKDEQDFSDVSSILGLDFLKRYKISFRDKLMILEK
jgi:hypothetical protein